MAQPPWHSVVRPNAVQMACAGSGEAARGESSGEKAVKELKAQLSTASADSQADSMFSAPGPMQTSTPGTNQPLGF